MPRHRETLRLEILNSAPKKRRVTRYNTILMKEYLLAKLKHGTSLKQTTLVDAYYAGCNTRHWLGSRPSSQKPSQKTQHKTQLLFTRWKAALETIFVKLRKCCALKCLPRLERVSHACASPLFVNVLLVLTLLSSLRVRYFISFTESQLSFI